MWIKVVLIVAILLIALVAMRAPQGARHLALRRIAMLAFVLFAMASVVVPDVWNAIANALGVGRGTDLLLYVLVLVFLGYMASSYLRFRGLETQITQLARRIALDEAGIDPLTVPAPEGTEPSTVAARRLPA